MNTVLKVNSRRGRRMSERDALAWLQRMGFEKSASVPDFRRVHGGRRETIIQHWERTAHNDDGSSRYDSAITRTTFSI